MINGILQKNEITKISQPVTDIKNQVIPIIEKIQKLCFVKIGRYPGALALAHCQIEKENPLTFFVLKTGETIINPLIKAYDKETGTTNLEGCLSLAFRPEKKIKRFDRILVAYDSVINKKISKEIMWIDGKRSFIFQHEMDHFKNKYIY